MTQVLFFIAAIGTLAGAIGVVALRNPFFSVLSLAAHLISLAALFLLLRAQFVAAAQVIVYAGAVVVLYVFVVSYIGDGQQAASGVVLRVLGPLFGLALAIELCIAMLGAGLAGVTHKGAPVAATFGTPRQIGKLFLTTYLLPFELASLLLLVAAVGAVMLARRRRGLESEQEPSVKIYAPRAPFTGTMAEAAGVRSALSQENPPEPVVEPAGSAPDGGHGGGW